MKLIKDKKVADIKLLLEKKDLAKVGKIAIGVTALGIALLSSTPRKGEIHEIADKEYSSGTYASYTEKSINIKDMFIDECVHTLSEFDSTERFYVKESIILDAIKKNIDGDLKSIHEKNILGEDTDLELSEQLIVLSEDISKNPEKYNYDNSIYTDGISEYLGTYLVTSYCGCSACCDSATGITASGTVATPNHTLAADSSIPFGTKLVIDGQEYVVEDRGGAVNGKHLDMFFSDHSTALNVGTRYMDVYLENDSKKEAEVKTVPTKNKTLVLNNKYSK